LAKNKILRISCFLRVENNLPIKFVPQNGNQKMADSQAARLNLASKAIILRLVLKWFEICMDIKHLSSFAS